MRIIIDIPEEHYKQICENKEDAIIAHDTCRRIAHGTPLDDIEHEIRKYLEDECINENEANGIMFCLDIIDNHIGKEKP